jgi:hypothetical protein
MLDYKEFIRIEVILIIPDIPHNSGSGQMSPLSEPQMKQITLITQIINLRNPLEAVLKIASHYNFARIFRFIPIWNVVKTDFYEIIHSNCLL